MKRCIHALAFYYLAFVLGCATPNVQTEDGGGDIQLNLLEIGNIWRKSPCPPPIFVERPDGTGVPLFYQSMRPVGSEYVLGLAVLVVANQSHQAQKLHNWANKRWKIEIEYKDGQRKEFPILCNYRRLPSYTPPGITLKPGQMVAFIIGIADSWPFSQTYDGMPWLLPCRMRVVYSGDRIFQSNEIIIQASYLKQSGHQGHQGTAGPGDRPLDDDKTKKDAIP